MTFNQRARLVFYCLNPDYKCANEAERLLKQRSKEYMLLEGRLYKKSSARHPEARLVILEEETLGTIIRIHQQLGHAGYKKTYARFERKCYGITRGEVEWMVARCQNCVTNRPSTTWAPLQPIEVEKTFEHVQTDLIDMKHEPSDQFKWLLHAKDHFSKYSWLYPLKSKESEPIARALEEWLMAFGPPKIIQCNNGKEFRGTLLLVLKRHGIKLITSNPRFPQTQGLVEQAYGVVENKIKA